MPVAVLVCPFKLRVYAKFLFVFPSSVSYALALTVSEFVVLLLKSVDRLYGGVFATFVVAVVVADFVLPALSVAVTFSSYVFPSLKPV